MLPLIGYLIYYSIAVKPPWVNKKMSGLGGSERRLRRVYEPAKKVIYKVCASS